MMARERTETSAGGVVVRREAGELRYLLIRDSYANWGFPKGHLEQGEDAAAAARREVREETGVAAADIVASLGAIEWQFMFRGDRVHKICHFFLMEARDAATVPQEAEGITVCHWATFDEATRLIAYENARDVLRRAAAAINAEPPCPA